MKDIELLKRFSKYFLPYKKWIFVSLGAIPFAILATLLVPWLIVTIIDNYVMTGDTAGLHLIIGGMALAVLIGYLADAIYTYSLQKVGQLSIRGLREDLFQHSLTLPRAYYDKNPIGVTLSRMTSDTESIGESMAVGVLSIFTDLLKTTALFIFLAYLSWKLTLLMMVILPPVIFILSFLRKKLRTYFNKSRETLAGATAFLQECLNGVKTVQLYAAEKKVLHQFDKKNHKFFKAQCKSNIYDATLFSMIDGLTSVTMVLIILYGTGQIFEGIITIGILIGFLNILTKIFIPIREFAQQIALIQRSLSALEHIEALIIEKPEAYNTHFSQTQLEHLTHFKTLEFEHVYFKYESSSQWILNDVSFKLKKGEKIAIVGATGSGKSTIIRLITKVYGKYEGSIRVNGLELSEIPRSVLLKSIALMQQDIFLFNETVKFNISLNRDSITQQKIESAAQFVYADEFIKELPDQYNYLIKGNGQNLSAGQAQLISFARALADNSDLVLLDEATSSVDSVTENFIQKAIEKIFRTRTVIAVAHRLSTIRNSDNILVMKEGKIVEQGNHDQLLEQKGYYVQLVEKLEEGDKE